MGDKHNDDRGDLNLSVIYQGRNPIGSPREAVQEALEALGQAGTTCSSQTHENYVYHILNQAILIASEYVYEEIGASDEEENDSQAASGRDETSDDFLSETPECDIGLGLCDQDRGSDDRDSLDQRDESRPRTCERKGKE